MSKAIEENKKKVTKQYFNLYWKYMCTDENNKKKKMNVPFSASTFFFN